VSVDSEAGPAPATLPAGAKDVLPVEAEELRDLEGRIRAVSAGFGYREVMTPVLELAEVLDRAQEGGVGAAFRLFDDHGRVLVLRPDLTIPVARLVATRLADHPGPVRVAYVARVFRPPPPGRAQAAEERQAGAELVGAGGPGADAEVIALLVAALADAGLADGRVAVGDVSVTGAVLDGLDVEESRRERLRAAARARNLVAWRRAVRELDLAEPGRTLLAELPSLRGGGEVLERVATAVPAAEAACRRLARLLELLADHAAGGAVMIDLGVLRDWAYYSGVVFEAYAPQVGAPVAMGGRYDGMAGRFGRARPAVGFTITLDRLHRAVVGPRATAPTRAGVVLVGGMDDDLAAARAVRAAGLPVVALPAGDERAERLAEADGWRWVAARAGDGYRVLDRLSGQSFACAELEEALPSPR
jgi:ATP phosphoribosyltransferase regulatory subunit